MTYPALAQQKTFTLPLFLFVFWIVAVEAYNLPHYLFKQVKEFGTLRKLKQMVQILNISGKMIIIDVIVKNCYVIWRETERGEKKFSDANFWSKMFPFISFWLRLQLQIFFLLLAQKNGSGDLATYLIYIFLSHFRIFLI